MLEKISISLASAGDRRDIAVVHVVGQLDSVTSAQLDKALNSLLTSRTFKIIVNLERVTYVSSAGWGIFLGILKELRTNKGDLKLAGIGQDVMEVIRLLDIDSFLPIHRTVDDAAKAFGRDQSH